MGGGQEGGQEEVKKDPCHVTPEIVLEQQSFRLQDLTECFNHGFYGN